MQTHERGEGHAEPEHGDLCKPVPLVAGLSLAGLDVGMSESVVPFSCSSGITRVPGKCVCTL